MFRQHQLNKWFGKKIVHVEAPHIFGEKLVEHCKKYLPTCYCICPSNYHYVSSVFGLGSYETVLTDEFQEIYLILKEMGINLQLHVHISMIPENVSYEKKRALIYRAYEFFTKELGIVPTEIVFGWFEWDKDCEEICKKLGLRIIDKHFHIYDWWLK